MQDILKILENINEDDYYENVNLHIHTNISDGILSPQEVVDKAREIGLRIISITDHNSVEAYKNIPVGKIDSLTIIPGIEFDCWYKTTLVHILGYGIDIHNEGISKRCAKNNLGKKTDFFRFFNTRKVKDVIKCIKAAGGIAVLAHPACCWNPNLKKMIEELKELGLDGIEAYYPYVSHRGLIKFYSAKVIKDIATDLNLIITGGADTHGINLRAR